jgi:hypothetical protein
MRHPDDAAPFRLDPPLVVRDGAGHWTEAFRALRRGMGMPA